MKQTSNDLSHLKKIDKDRLTKVLSVIDVVGIKFPTREITDALGVGKSTVSVYLSGEKPMSTNFYKKFMEYFGGVEPLIKQIKMEGDNQGLKYTDDWMPIVKELAQSVGAISTSNKLLSESNKDLTDIVKHHFNVQKTKPVINLDENQGTLEVLKKYLPFLADGLGKDLKIDPTDLLARMGKLILEEKEEKK